MNFLYNYLQSLSRKDTNSLTESKHLLTHKGVTSTRDHVAAMSVAMFANANILQKRNHQVAKSRLEKTTRQYSDVLASRIQQIRNNYSEESVKEVKRSFKELYFLAFALGLSGSSVGLIVGNQSKSPEDDRWVESAFNHEMRFFNKFLKNCKDLSIAQIQSRIRMYMNTVKSVYDGARVLGAHPDSIIHWVYTPEAQHCSSCVYLRDHSPYTKRTLPTTPRSGATECLSNCKCYLRIVLSDPDMVRLIEQKSLSRQSHLTYLQQLHRRRSTHWHRRSGGSVGESIEVEILPELPNKLGK